MAISNTRTHSLLLASRILTMNKLLALVVLATVLGSVACQDPVVVTPLGPVKGTFLKTRRGESFLGFRGLRYAQPPVGELRFKPPLAVEAWMDVYDATEDGPQCTQPGGGPPGSEDCLFLNVYTKKVNSTDTKPVLVFIHAGGFYSLSGQSSLYGPDYLMDQDIVLVTINYRLATLGYLSTGDKHAPGNYGMKDQVAALRWVQKNIAAFGGDPGNVTIGGYSAGSASVMLHMVSPMSRGLFHRGIAMSGSAASTWAINKDPLRLAVKQAELLGCPTNTTEALVNCVKQLPAQRTASIYSGLWEWGYDPLVVLSPVVEADLGNGEERFLTRDPVQALQDGDFAQVPLIIGTTKDEFSNRAIFIIQNASWAEDMSNNWNQVAPIPFMYDRNDNISQQLRQFYLGDLVTPISNNSLGALGRLYADSVIIFGAVRAAEIISATSAQPVYLYQFSYQGEFSHVYWPGTEQPFGVVHHDDLIYLFYISSAFPRFNTTGEDAAAVDRSTTLWGNFVKTGNPTPPDSSPLLMWPAFTSERKRYLEIGDKLVVHEGVYYQDRINLWNTLFPLPPKPKQMLT